MIHANMTFHGFCWKTKTVKYSTWILYYIGSVAVSADSFIIIGATLCEPPSGDATRGWRDNHLVSFNGGRRMCQIHLMESVFVLNN